MVTISLLMIFLIIGLFVAGIPIGICAIVKSSKVGGWRKGVLLPLSILSLVLYFVALGFLDSNVTYLVITLTGLAMGISTLSVSAHFVSKQTNKIYTDKTIEHQESVAEAIKKEQSYIDELKELKGLLDSGAITQQDYDKKKDEILNRK